MPLHQLSDRCKTEAHQMAAAQYLTFTAAD
ncbi:hypothetical protein ABIC28_003361 [Rhodococcus sp. PvR044]|jgi:hypothetical protein